MCVHERVRVVKSYGARLRKRRRKTEQVCYLPHYAIRNESSAKFRVVFDASCKTDTGISLNDVLLKGPVIQDELLFIIARFRTHNYVLTADIAKMYRQILITDKHRDYQRILWRSDSNSPVQIYRLNTQIQSHTARCQRLI